MTIERVKELAELTKKKPHGFNHICWAGSSIRVLHKWTQDRFYQCSYAGKKNWMTPACEECDGNHDAEIESLDKTDRWYNYGIEAIVEALRKELEDETTE